MFHQQGEIDREKVSLIERVRDRESKRQTERERQRERERDEESRRREGRKSSGTHMAD